MTIIVFLIDTSASMNQRAYLGGRPTLLDVAKGAVETFVKVRQKSPESRGDRYMLLTFEEPPANIKAGWKENLATFINELKNLQCLGMTTMGAALKHAFDVLNINRMQTGIDTYGQGRCPFYLEPSVIVVITDGGKLSSNAGVQDDFNLPMNCPIPGSELTREPFRWDQRLFSLVLRLSGTPAVERDTGLVPSDSSPIDAMCEVTGGRSYCITSHRMLMQCIDSLVQKVQSGVVINFEKVGPDPPPLDLPGREGGEILPGDEGINEEHKNDTYDPDIDKNGTRWNGGNHFSNNVPAAWHSCRRLIYVPRTLAQKGFAVGFWPIPESFRPDPNAPTLPPRTAHPAVKFTCTSQEPMVIDNLPFDKYELEPSPLTQFILARKQPTICWQVFVANSSKGSEMGQPFGYLKASTNLTCVNLFVMPYNYPVLLPLLDELFKVHRCKPPPEWKMAFQQYIDRMPSYYVTPLKKALTKMGAPSQLMLNLIPDTQDNSLSYSVHNYLKRLKNQAKIDFDKLCNDVLNKSSGTVGATNLGGAQRAADGVRVVPRSPLKRDVTGHPCLQDKFLALRDQLNEFGGFVIGMPRSGSAAGRRPMGARAYRNPFDVRRRDLLDQVVRMRANLLAGAARTRLLDEDSLHCMPVAQMGNYQEYLKRQAPQLREIESPPVRQHMFGNPFKIDKRMMMVDEADLDATAVGGATNNTTVSGNTTTSIMRSLSAGGASRRPNAPASPGPPAPKRKPGPLPAHIVARRPSSPASPAPPTPLSTSVLSQLPPLLPSTLSPPITSVALTPVLTAVESVPGRPPEDSLFNDVFTPSFPEPRVIPHIVINQYQQPPQPIVTYNNSVAESKPMVNGDAYPLSRLGISPPPSPPPLLPSLPISPLLSSPLLSSPILPAAIQPSSAPLPSSHPAPAPQPDVQQQISMILHEAALAPRPSRQGNTAGITYPILISSSSFEPIHIPERLSQKEVMEITRHNLDVRSEIFKAIRRPGRDFSDLFNKLKLLKGCITTKKEMMKCVIDESLRFKRRHLAKLLEEFTSTLDKNGNTVLQHPIVKKDLKEYSNAFSESNHVTMS